DHALDDSAEEGGLGRQVLRALDLAAEPMAFELGQDFVHRGAGDVHLIERLHGREPGRAAPIGFTRILVLAGGGVHRRHRGAARRRRSRTIASAARAASPPLSPSPSLARAQACASLSTVMIPLPTAIARATERSINARADSIETISKWMVSPRITQPSATTPS